MAALALAALAIGSIAGFAIRKRRKAAQQQLEQEMNWQQVKQSFQRLISKM